MKLHRILILILAVLAMAEYAQAAVLFQEGFEDGNLSTRGWYDNTTLKLSSTEHLATGQKSVEYHFTVGSKTPEISGGSIRRKFTETESVFIRYYIKHSATWVGSNRSYHPHEIMLLTNLDSDYWGPSVSHLTTYLEENGGYAVLSIQDSLNIDQSRINVDLTATTEQRAVAGCNGSVNDGYVSIDCYGSSSGYRNEKKWKSASPVFQDAAGPYSKTAWHRIEVYFKLNSIVNGKGIADGSVQYWYDGALLIDIRNALLRTGQNPSMKFNQLLIAPYIGDGSPVDQTFWIDDLLVDTAVSDAIAPSPPGNLRVD